MIVRFDVIRSVILINNIIFVGKVNFCCQGKFLLASKFMLENGSSSVILKETALPSTKLEIPGEIFNRVFGIRKTSRTLCDFFVESPMTFFVYPIV
jgi:hypothetical protein